MYFHSGDMPPKYNCYLGLIWKETFQLNWCTFSFFPLWDERLFMSLDVWWITFWKRISFSLYQRLFLLVAFYWCSCVTYPFSVWREGYRCPLIFCVLTPGQERKWLLFTAVNYVVFLSAPQSSCKKVIRSALGWYVCMMTFKLSTIFTKLSCSWSFWSSCCSMICNSSIDDRV